MKDFAKRILSDVSEGQEFVLHKKGLRKVRSIIELRAELERMSDEEFTHHVSGHKNDFAKWIEHCVKDESLAKDLKSIKSKDEIIDLLNARIDFAVTIIEEENRQIIKSELAKLKELENDNLAKEEVHKDISALEKDLKTLQSNIDVENEALIEEENDFELKNWKEIQPIPANARVAEFLFGLVVGLILGLIIARAVLPM